MADEPEPTQTADSTETPMESIPTDFKEYDHWRRTGELRAKAETKPAAAEAVPQAKTEPNSEADTNQQTEDDEETGRQRSGSRQRKIDRLTRENEELRRQIATVPRPAEPPKPEPAATGKPKLADYRTLEEYQEALTDWKLDQREAAAREKASQEAQKAAEQKIQTEWDSRQNAVRTAHSDYDEVVQSVAAPEGPGVLAARQAMLEDDAGPEILYHLATHPDDLKRIAALQPVSAIREIRRLSAALSPPSSAAAANPKPKISSAPRPPPSLSRPAKTSSDSIHDEELARTDYGKWEKLRIAQLKER